MSIQHDAIRNAGASAAVVLAQSTSSTSQIHRGASSSHPRCRTTPGQRVCLCLEEKLCTFTSWSELFLLLSRWLVGQDSCYAYASQRRPWHCPGKPPSVGSTSNLTRKICPFPHCRAVNSHQPHICIEIWETQLGAS